MSLDPFVLLCQAHGLPRPETEIAFHDVRKWRFDYGWKVQRVALECEGGLWTRGRHVRARGFEHDCVKYAEAVLAGWKVFRASPRQLEDGTAIEWLRRALDPSAPQE
jgi:hypothetical protein